MKIVIYSLILLFLFSCFVNSQTNYGLIKGRLLDFSTGDPITGANVYLADRSKVCNTDNTGSFFIKNLSVGEYTLYCSMIGFCTQAVNIKIDSLFPVVIQDVFLKRALIPLIVSDSLKEYHQMISTLDPSEILEVKIDNVMQDAEFINLTIKNISSVTVYLIEDLPCFRTIGISIKNESGEEVKRNIMNMGCDVMGINYLPQMNNLKSLEPKQSICFSNVRTWYKLNDKERYKGKYIISAIYVIKEFEYLPGIFGCPGDQSYDGYKDEKYVLSRATRGRYESVNTFVYDNR